MFKGIQTSHYFALQAHGKTLPEGMSDRLLAAIERIATREFASFVVSEPPPHLGPSLYYLIRPGSCTLVARLYCCTDVWYCCTAVLPTNTMASRPCAGPLHKGRSRQDCTPAEHGAH